ncbi:MAG: lysine--tRNA ligase [candidate division Zixibacteria bacterium]|nr:lysine--tRNA ligase [candidate division Zixibacteria bacterium]
MSDEKPQEPTVPVNQVIEGRIEKLNKLREMGINPYPYTYNVTHNTKQLLDGYDELAEKETPIQTAGRIMAIRKMGKAAFLHFMDEWGRLQCYMKKNVIGDELWEQFLLLDMGDFIGMKGTMFTTRTGEQTVKIEEFEILTKSLHPLPEKWHGLTDKETRYRQRYVDLIVNQEVRDVFKTRSKVLQAIRNFLNDRGFMEVETPVLQPLYGGGIAVPFVTHHRKLDMDLYLRIADELYLKRLIVGGYDKVWEMCKDFRNEGLDRKHNPEFTMIELYQAFADYHDMMDLYEDLLRHTIKEVSGNSFLEYEGEKIEFGEPFKRISMIDAVKENGGPDLSDFDFDKALKLAKDANFDKAKMLNHGKIVEAFFDELVEPTLQQPTFIIDHPKDISPLAKVHRDNPNLAERYELFACGMELGNAFSELNDPLDQKQRFIDQGKVAEAGDEEAHQLDHDFINALMYGMPPTGGLGIGVDRIVMLCTNQHSIQDVLFFPQMRSQKEE